MLHAKPNENFFEYSSSAGLDGDACRLILNRLDDDICARFLGSPTIGEGFGETTAAHVVRTYQNLESHLSAVLPSDKQTSAMLESLKAKIMIHDTSDILRENIVAATEVNPVLKAQIANNIDLYDMIVTPFTYKLALFANKEKQPEIFDETILSLRERTISPDQIGRQLSMDEVLSFTMQSIAAVSEEEQKFSRFAAWDNAESQYKVNTMLVHYNCIERAIGFTGVQAQIHEKCDGTDYSLSVSEYKQQHNIVPNIYHVSPSLTNRINGRFEKNIGKMFDCAGYTDQELVAAAATVNYCYGVSEKSFALGKHIVGFHAQENEPNITDSKYVHEMFNSQQESLFKTNPNSRLIRKNTVVGFYQEARHDLKHNGVVWLPEDGKTLAESTTVTKRFLPKHLHSTLKNMQ